MKHKLINNDPRCGPNKEYFLCQVQTKEGPVFTIPFTKHEVQRAFERRKRVFPDQKKLNSD